ncbi:MAG: hypothetical protein IKA03_04670 [Alphaproteobacteria bacterium]|nr:hypothetical protein [Alphaproteobacteria bacterium]
MRSNQNGSTMLETIGAMMVVSMVSIGIISLVGKMFNAFKQNMVANEIKEVQKNITDRYRADGNYEALEGISAQDAYKEKLIPAQMLVGNKIVHRQNGEVELGIGEEEIDNEKENYFTVKFKGLTNGSCIDLSQIAWNSASSTDLYAITINNNKTFKVPLAATGIAPGSDNALPITIEKAVGACNAGDDDNVIKWTFY